MNQDLVEKLARVKVAVKDMIRERDGLSRSHVFYPSELWREANKSLDYIFDLSLLSLKDLRLHTSFLTGVPWFTHSHHPYRQWKSDSLKKQHIPLIQEYARLTEGIPEKYWCDEPVNAGSVELVGVRYKGKLVSDDIMRYQRCVSNLYKSDVFRHLEERDSTIVEIGAGYGGLAHQIKRSIGRKSNYIVVDLPEVIYWSACYILLNNPDAKVLIYDPNDLDLLEAYENYDFIFIPNYKSDLLSSINEVNLVVNLLSFQEMRDDQIRKYLNIISKNINGFLYSENYTRHWMNHELKMDVQEILSEYFSLRPKPESYEMINNANQVDKPGMLWCLFPFIGRSKKIDPDRKIVVEQFFTPYGDKSFEFDS